MDTLPFHPISRSAAKTARTPQTRLRMTYSIAIPVLPFSSSPSVSRAKEENVVKPPQMPTFKKSTTLGFKAFFAAKAATRPITKHPMTLIRNVFIGSPFSGLTGSNVIRYLQIAPRAPPSPTIITFKFSLHHETRRHTLRSHRSSPDRRISSSGDYGL